mmetsp:Transcript_52664/g.114318  ORF Transcript_52664/g.114318 Transcript_52664/m.114318 type:complete len:223 (-) Transcript_52664:819-1487(-)
MIADILGRGRERPPAMVRTRPDRTELPDVSHVAISLADAPRRFSSFRVAFSSSASSASSPPRASPSDSELAFLRLFVGLAAGAFLVEGAALALPPLFFPEHLANFRSLDIGSRVPQGPTPGRCREAMCKCARPGANVWASRRAPVPLKRLKRRKRLKRPNARMGAVGLGTAVRPACMPVSMTPSTGLRGALRPTLCSCASTELIGSQSSLQPTRQFPNRRAS